MKMRILIALCAGILPAAAANAALLSEFEPNPAGGDPSTQDVELSGGTPLAAFDLWILSIENDGYNGLVDRATNVTGSYDAAGFAVVTIGDLENPSNTVILTDSFTGSTSTDLDPADNGVLDLSTIGTVLDAVGVSDSSGDDATLYGSLLGGTDILYNGQFEPLLVFRDGVTGDWYQSVTADFNQPSQRLAVFAAAAGPEISPSAFTPTVSGPTFGGVNPTLIPEPGTVALALLSLASAGAVSMRSRLG